MSAIRAAVLKKKEELARCIPGIVWLFHVPCQYSQSMWTCTMYWKLQFFFWAEILTCAWSNSFDLYRCDALHSPVVIKVRSLFTIYWDWDIFLPKLLKICLLRWTSEILRGTYYTNKPRAKDPCPLAMPAQAEVYGGLWTAGLSFKRFWCPIRPERNMGRDGKNTWMCIVGICGKS